jgi:hypothetical protein
MNALAPARHLALVVVFLTVLMASSIPASAGAQDSQGCGGYTSQEIAQAVLDIAGGDEDLDPDGNGIACDHDENEEGAGGDADTYLAGIQDELDTVAASLERYAEINASFSDASAAEQRDMVDEILEIADFWAEYPNVAAEFEAPEGFDDLENTYLDFADAVGETGELWLAWWDIPSGDADEDAAYDAFEDAFADAQDELDDLQGMLDDAGGSNSATDDPTEEPANEVSSYLDDVSEHADSLNADLVTFSNGGETITEKEIDGIFENFADAPEVAANIDVPDGYDDVQDAYVDFTDQLALIPDLYAAWVEDGMSESYDDPLDDPLLTELVFATNNAYDLHETLTAVIEEFESAATSGTEAPWGVRSGPTDSIVMSSRAEAPAEGSVPHL